MDSRRPCRRCGLLLGDDEAVTLGCGRYGPTAGRSVPDSLFEQETYVAVLCQPCSRSIWPAVRDLVRVIAPLEATNGC